MWVQFIAEGAHNLAKRICLANQAGPDLVGCQALLFSSISAFAT